MLLIIDGYNLIFAYQNLPDTPKSLEKARDNLLQVLTKYNLRRQYQIIVVFDGRESYTHKQTGLKIVANIEVIFSARGVTADTVISDIVIRHQQPKNITVVTEDRSLARAVLSNGAKTFKSGDFIDELRPTTPQPEMINEPQEKISGVADKHQVEAWLKLFGVEENQP
ncbi:MAG: NYN domain-containing protein [Planctomycetota bacterium]